MNEAKNQGTDDDVLEGNMSLFVGESKIKQPKPVKKRDKGNWLIYVPILLIVVLAPLAVWLWWKDNRSPDKPTKKSPAVVQKEEKEITHPRCDALGNRAYLSEKFGFGFCYPRKWGEVTANNAKHDPSDPGERWRITFTVKNMVSVGVASPDWSSKTRRDFSCTDAATTTLPPFSPFSTKWQSDETMPTPFFRRGIEVKPGEYLQQEYTDNLLVHGACLQAYLVLKNNPYKHVTMSYGAQFDLKVNTPQEHVENPTRIIPTGEREIFTAFTKTFFPYPE